MRSLSREGVYTCGKNSQHMCVRLRKVILGHIFNFEIIISSVSVTNKL